MIQHLVLKKKVILSMTRLDDFINLYNENIEKFEYSTIKNKSHLLI